MKQIRDFKLINGTICLDEMVHDFGNCHDVSDSALFEDDNYLYLLLMDKENGFFTLNVCSKHFGFDSSITLRSIEIGDRTNQEILDYLNRKLIS